MFHHLEISAVSYTKAFYLLLRKTHKRSQITGINHREFIKIIQCGLCPYFFNGQDISRQEFFHSILSSDISSVRASLKTAFHQRASQFVGQRRRPLWEFGSSRISRIFFFLAAAFPTATHLTETLPVATFAMATLPITVPPVEQHFPQQHFPGQRLPPQHLSPTSHTSSKRILYPSFRIILISIMQDIKQRNCFQV